MGASEGVRHHKLSLLAICVVAVLSGARSFEAIAQWARGSACSRSWSGCGAAATRGADATPPQ